jgi:hypothetical protein
MRAMTVDPADSVAFLQRREAARQRDLDARFRTAWADFDRIVEMIVREFAPLRIWQWGSLLHRRHFSGRSDIDIAVEGLAVRSGCFGSVLYLPGNHLSAHQSVVRERPR